MNDPKRKPNRLYAYDYSQNGAYFITICTQDRKKILSSIVGDGSSVPKPYGIIAEEMIAQISVKYPSVTVDMNIAGVLAMPKSVTCNPCSTIA